MGEAGDVSLKELKRTNYELVTLLKQIYQAQYLPKAHKKSGVRTLPDEIIGEIIQSLPQYDVHPFLLVSRSINRIARIRLWRRIYVSSPNKLSHGHHDNVDRKLWSVVSPTRFLQLMESYALEGCERLVLCNTRFSSVFYHKLVTSLPDTDITVLNLEKTGARKVGQMFTSEFVDNTPKLLGTSLEVTQAQDSTVPASIFWMSNCSGWTTLRHLRLENVSIDPGDISNNRCKLESLVCGGVNLDNINRYVDLRTIKQFMVTTPAENCLGIAKRLRSCTHLCLFDGKGNSQFLKALASEKLHFVRIHLVKGATTRHLYCGLPYTTLSTLVSSRGETPLAPWVTFIDTEEELAYSGQSIQHHMQVDSVICSLMKHKVDLSKLTNLVLDGRSYQLHRVMGELVYATRLSNNHKTYFHETIKYN
ncbi:hypothetical protein DICA3_D01728 [Diutina catenulata]